MWSCLRALLVLLLTLLPVGPAHAAYTAAEAASLRQMRLAMLNLLEQMERSCGTAATAEACIALSQGFFELTQAVGWLFHVNVNPDDGAGGAFLAPYIVCFTGSAGANCTAQRAPVVAAAWLDLDRALLELARASSFRGQADYDAAVQALGQVDRTLPYAAPFPPLYPQKFGPHGNYDRAQQTLWSMIQYGNSSLKGWLAGVQRGTLPACPNLFISYARALKTGLVDTWFLAAHIVDPRGEFGAFQTPFTQGLDTASDTKRALTEFALINGPTGSNDRSTTYRLRFVGDAAATCLRASNPDLYEFLRRYADSWANVDAWNGWALVIE